LLEAFVGGLAAEGARGAMVVVVVLPLLELVVEDAGVIDNDALEHAVELFVVAAPGGRTAVQVMGACQISVVIGDSLSTCTAAYGPTYAA
jgi:hypothetical protein